MKRLMSTAASRAWLAVAAIGFAMVVLVLVLGLIPRMGAGQELIDTASPAFSDANVAGTRAGIDFVSTYVDLADPLVTRAGGASREVPGLIALVTRRTGLSSAQVRRVLKRRAPHTAALLRAVPFSRASNEVPRFTRFIANTLVTDADSVQTTLVQRYPRLAQTLAALRNVTSGWNGVPGVEGRLERLNGSAVTTAPQLRDYYRRDLVPLLERDKDEFHELAGSGGIGYIPHLLLIVGIVVCAFGLYSARVSFERPAGRRSWSGVVAIGVLLVATVGALGYFPRLGGADRLVKDFKPVFAQERVDGALAAADFLHETVRFGDPIATRRAAAKNELRRLVRFIGDSSALTESQVRRALLRVSPRIMALMTATPLSAIAAEVPKLVTYLSRKTKLSDARLLAALERSAPGLATSLQAVPPVALGWDDVPRIGELTRFDGLTPVRTMPELEAYVREDLVAVLPSQRENFDELGSSWPPLNVFPPLLLGLGLLLAVYGLVMMRFATARR